MDPTLDLPYDSATDRDCGVQHEPTEYLHGEDARRIFDRMHINRDLIEYAYGAWLNEQDVPWAQFSPPQGRGGLTRSIFVGSIAYALHTHTEWKAEVRSGAYVLRRYVDDVEQLLYICAKDKLAPKDHDPLHHLGYRPSLKPLFNGHHKPLAEIWVLQYSFSTSDVSLKLGPIVCLGPAQRAGADVIAVADGIEALSPTPETASDAEIHDLVADYPLDTDDAHTHAVVDDETSSASAPPPAPHVPPAPQVPRAPQVEESFPLASTRPEPADKQEPRMWRAAQLLRFSRLYAERSLDEHAETLGIDVDTLALWELSDPPADQEGVFPELFDPGCIGTRLCPLNSDAVPLYSGHGRLAELSPKMEMHEHLVAAVISTLQLHHQVPEFHFPAEVLDAYCSGWLDDLVASTFGEEGCGSAPIIPQLEALGVTVVGLPHHEDVISASGFFHELPVIALGHHLSPAMIRLRALHELCRLVNMRVDKAARTPIKHGNLLEKIAFGPHFAQRVAEPTTFPAAREFLEQTAAAAGLPVYFAYSRAVKIRPEWSVLEQWALHHEPPHVVPTNEIPLRQQLMASFIAKLPAEFLLPEGASPLLRQARNLYGQLDLSAMTEFHQTPLEDSVFCHVHASRMRAFTNHQRDTGEALRWMWREDSDGYVRKGALVELVQRMCMFIPIPPQEMIYALLL